MSRPLTASRPLCRCRRWRIRPLRCTCPRRQVHLHASTNHDFYKDFRRESKKKRSEAGDTPRWNVKAGPSSNPGCTARCGHPCCWLGQKPLMLHTPAPVGCSRYPESSFFFGAWLHRIFQHALSRWVDTCIKIPFSCVVWNWITLQKWAHKNCIYVDLDISYCICKYMCIYIYTDMRIYMSQSTHILSVFVYAKKVFVYSNFNIFAHFIVHHTMGE